MRLWVLPAMLALAATLGACGASGDAATGAPAAATPTTLPATIEGTLGAYSAEGSVDAQGYSEFNIGTLSVGDTELLVEVSGTLLRQAAIPPDGADVHVRATLGSKQTDFGADYYTVTKLERID